MAANTGIYCNVKKLLDKLLPDWYSSVARKYYDPTTSKDLTPMKAF